MIRRRVAERIAMNAVTQLTLMAVTIKRSESNDHQMIEKYWDVLKRGASWSGYI